MLDKIKKSKYNKHYVLIAAIIAISLLFIFSAYKKGSEERIKNRYMNILVRPDGSTYVEDIWDINIVDSSTVFQTFESANKDNFKDIKVSRFNERTNQWHELTYNDQIAYDGREDLDYYHAGYFAGNFEIAWGVDLEYSRARRKYKIEYTLNGPVKNYLDTAEYYHMFVGKSFELPIENFEANISFPAPLRDTNSYIWGHGAPTGNIQFNNGKVHVTAKNIKPRTFIEARALFPKELVYMAPEIKQNMKEYILEEERINTQNTVISKINDLNRQSYINKAQAVLILILAFIIVYESYRIIRIKTKYSKGFVKEWDRFTDLPETKLDIFAANIIYKEKGAKNFLITVLMKLVHNNYIEIIETKDGNLNADSLMAYDEEVIEKTKILKKLADDRSWTVNEMDLAKVFSIFKEETRKSEIKSLGIKLKDVNQIKYKLNLDKINTAIEKNLLERDEQFVVEFLFNLYNKEKQFKGSGDSNLTKALKKAKVKIDKALFIEANRKFSQILELEKQIIYIDQYQLINEIAKNFGRFEVKYEQLISKEKAIKDKEEIYSLEKEKASKKLIIRPIIQSILFSFISFVLLVSLIGSIQFNEAKYIQLVFYMMLSNLLFTFISMYQLKILTPFLKEKGKNIRAEYKGLYNFFNNDSFISEYPEESVVIWGEFLVLATYFGVATKVLSVLQKVHPEVLKQMNATIGTNYMSTYHLWRTISIANDASSYVRRVEAGKAFASGVSSFVTSGGGSSFTSGGGGGGFSAGGGRGFGGGGGGTR